MRRQTRFQAWGVGLVALAVALVLANPAWGQQQGKSAADEMKGGPVVRTFGVEGGYRTEVTSETKGTVCEEDRRQVAVLTAQVFQHIDEARQAIDADDLQRARREVDKGRQAMKAIRALEPSTIVRTRTKAPDGKVVYDDEREVQEDRVPLFEGMLHAQTLAPIVEAKRDATAADNAEVKGVRLVESESIRTRPSPTSASSRVSSRGRSRPWKRTSAMPPRRPWPWPRSGAWSSATAGRTRRWPRPATRSGWPGGRSRRTMPSRPGST
jgi:hypothetical protein